MATGPEITGRCICEAFREEFLELHVPRFFCLICSSWPAIRAKTEEGEDLFPGCTGRGGLTELRAVARQQGWGRAAKLGAHAFRRGAARAILSSGGSFAQLLKGGQWYSSAYQRYLDLGREG